MPKGTQRSVMQRAFNMSVRRSPIGIDLQMLHEHFRPEKRAGDGKIGAIRCESDGRIPHKLTALPGVKSLVPLDEKMGYRQAFPCGRVLASGATAMPNAKNPSGLPPQSGEEPTGGIRSAVRGIFRKEGDFWTVGYGE